MSRAHKIEEIVGTEGLIECTVCTGAEGTLPTDCPGIRIPANQQDQIHRGELDYKDGEWAVPPNITRRVHITKGSGEKPVTPRPDFPNVDHPSHYGGDTTYEHVKVAIAWGLDKRAFLYNCTKYLCRLGKKPIAAELEDLEKAKWYLEKEIEQLKKA